MPQQRKTKAQYAAGAKVLAEGGTIRASLLAAGYTDKQARKGKAAITRPMLKAMAAQGMKLGNISKALSMQEMGDISMGRLVTNCITGTDKGAMSAKILGSHRELNLWTPDSQVGIVVLNAPQYALDHKTELLKDFGDPIT